jgi:hypothetical protein
MPAPTAGRISDSSGSGEVKLARRLAGAPGEARRVIRPVTSPGELAGLGAQRPHV